MDVLVDGLLHELAPRKEFGIRGFHDTSVAIDGARADDKDRFNDHAAVFDGILSLRTRLRHG